MKIRILGCGGSFGVPSIPEGWGQCDPQNSRNRRMRSSILIESKGVRVLVDTGPDLREQLLSAQTKSIDGVIYTHSHADHTHGIDDLRGICRLMNKAIPIYGFEETLSDLKKRFPYVFEPLDLGIIYKASLIPHPVSNHFQIEDLQFDCFPQQHGHSRTLGFRLNNFAYTTDVWKLPEEAFSLLQDLDVWMVGCLGLEPHPTHAHLDKVLSWASRLKAKQIFLTHLSEAMDYENQSKTLPFSFSMAFDGMEINC